MVQMHSVILLVFALCISAALSARIPSDGSHIVSSTTKKRSKTISSGVIIGQSKSFKKKESSNSKGSELSIVAQRAVLANIRRRLPFNSKPVATPSVVVIGPPPSSLAKINVLMLMFYTTLGAAMPYIPLYYRSIGLSNNQVGLLGAITPAVTFLASPFWGALADSTGWHKHIMLLTFTGSVIVRSALALADKKTSILWLYLIVAFSAVLNAPVKPLMDSAVMSMLRDKSDYGRSRLFGQIGFGLGSYVVGPLISSDIRLIFLMQLVFAVPTAILMAGFQPTQAEKKKEDIDILAAFNHMIADPKVIVFFSMVFLIGVSSGIVENFAYMRIAEVGGNSGNVLGVCRLLSSLAGGPMFWLSGAISKQIGVNGVLTWSFCSYVLRFFIYASIKNPWQAIPAEILRGTTFAVFWAGSTYFVYTVSPQGLTATMLSILNGVYGGLGQSVGALVGGAMSKQYGISKSFYMCGAVDFAVLSLFALYQLRLRLINTNANVRNIPITAQAVKSIANIKVKVPPTKKALTGEVTRKILEPTNLRERGKKEQDKRSESRIKTDENKKITVMSDVEGLSLIGRIKRVLFKN